MISSNLLIAKTYLQDESSPHLGSRWNLASIDISRSVKMAEILQTFKSKVHCIKNVVTWLKFHWSFTLLFQLHSTIKSVQVMTWHRVVSLYPNLWCFSSIMDRSATWPQRVIWITKYHCCIVRNCFVTVNLTVYKFHFGQRYRLLNIIVTNTSRDPMLRHSLAIKCRYFRFEVSCHLDLCLLTRKWH